MRRDSCARSNNNYLIAGVASNCKIMSISHPLTSYPNIAQSLADGFNFAWNNGASVISNSWGGIAQSDILDDAIEASLTYGRNGLGCVVVFLSAIIMMALSYILRIHLPILYPWSK